MKSNQPEPNNSIDRYRAASNLGYTVDIGIECHVQLKTASKLFCTCSNDARDAEPNTTVCPLCLGLPGTLPVLNKRAVELAIQAGLALNSEVARHTEFDRKNYFYPDLPKGYQITQYDQPIIGPGQVEVPLNEGVFTVGITRAHLEEDAGKLLHPAGADYSLVDLNRAGTPLLEIVSEPDMHSPAEAKAFAQELYQRMRYAEVSDVDLYHGNMRFDVNVSVRKPEAPLGTRTETKNLNSFRSVERAAEYEIKRQIKLLEKGQAVIQETRGYDDATGKTSSQRGKEEAMDYRYFKEPDLPPLVISEAMVTEIRRQSPMMLAEIRQQLQSIGVDASTVNAILNQPRLASLQLDIIKHYDETTAKRSASWLSGEVLRQVSAESFDWESFQLDPGRLVELSTMVEEGLLSSTGAKAVLAEMITGKETPKQLAKRLDVVQVSDTKELESIIDSVVTANPKAAADVRSGEAKAIGFLVGQVMKASRGQANPQKVQEIIKTKLLS